jgi:HK97 family phage major capsid protein
MGSDNQRSSIKISNAPALIHRQGSTVKAVNGNTGGVEGYLVTWGNPQDTDLQGEHFTPRTEFCLDWFRERPVLYHHGLDGEAGLRRIGTIKSVEIDDLGLWVQAQLDLRDRYANAVYDMVKAKEFGWSSGSVDHLVKIATNGEIAVWPLIEGSITPTPAQPAKTSVRAFKAILSGYNDSRDYLRGLDARVDQSGLSRATSSLYIPDGFQNSDPRVFAFGAKASGGYKSSEVSMARNSAKRLAKKFADAFGIKADEDDLDAVASEVEPQVDAEVATAAAEELEMEAALAALEKEMVGEQETKSMRRSTSSTRARNTRSLNRRAYRANEFPAVEADAEEIAAQLEDEIAAQMDAVAGDMADQIATEMETELATQAEEQAMEKAAARAIRKRAWRRAMRQLDATNDIGANLDLASIDAGGTGVSDPAYLGADSASNPPIENYKSRLRRRNSVRRLNRARRGYAYRGDELPLMADELPIMADELIEPTAASYRRMRRNAARRGYAYRGDEMLPVMADEMLPVMADEMLPVMADEMLPVMADELVAPTAASYRRARRNYARRARRGYAYRGDELPVAPIAADPEVALQAADDSVMMEEVAAQAYRNGFRKGIRRGIRTTDQIASPDVQISESNNETGNFDLVPEGGADITVASYRRGRRGAAGKRYSRARRGYATREDAALLANEPEAIQSNEEEAARAFRKGYRTALRRAMRNGEIPTNPAAMQDPEAVMGNFNDPAAMTDEATFPGAMQQDDVMTGATASYRRGGRNFRGKSGMSGYSNYNYNKQAEYWRNRAMKSEMTEVGGQRNFGGVRVTRDVADQPGAYNSAFKSYLYKGLGLLSETEKYTLTGKGQVNWGRGSFGMKSGQIVDGSAMKTYFGGSDSSVGFAVPPDWVAELNKNIMVQTVMAPECRTRTTTSDRIVQPNLITTDARRAHAARVRWPGEVVGSNTDHRSIEDQYSQVDVPIHVMLISLTAGNSALEDVTFSLEDEINEAFSEAVAIAYDELIWSGDGQGKMEGIVVNNQVTGTRSTGMQSVSGYVPSGSPDGIVTADVLKELLFHLPRGYRQRAKWYMNSNTGLQIATLKDGEGNYLIDQRDESLQAVGVPDRLLGKPIVYNEYADDIAENGYPIVLGDLSRGYIIGKRVDFSIRRFDDSQYAELDQVLFLGRARMGGQVLQPASVKVLKIAAS